MEQSDAFVAPATTTGNNIAPHVAALLNVMHLSDVIGIEGERTSTGPIYAGDAKLVLTVGGTAFEKAAAKGGSTTIKESAVRAMPDCPASSRSRDRQVSGRTSSACASRPRAIVDGNGMIAHRELSPQPTKWRDEVRICSLFEADALSFSLDAPASR